jgi:hypothetical protein
LTGLRIQLPDPSSCASPQEYIEQHLAPAATELHRIVNELLAPGATSAEEWSMDMMPEMANAVWQRLDRRLDETAKHVVFDGSEYFSIPKDLLKTKRAKVQLTAVVYAQKTDQRLTQVDFRLVRDDGVVIDNSNISTKDPLPHQITRELPFGDVPGCVSPDKRTYYLEARSLSRSTIPVCRRFSLSFVYI